MIHPVRPSLFFWCYLGLFSSFAWLFSSLKMDFLNKTTGLVAFLRLTIILSWFVANVLLYKVFMFFLHQPRHNRFFRGYERVGKTFGSALLFFGNIGLFYYSEKSNACMLTFLFLAFYCLCALFCVQPYTDFGVFEFLLGASLNEALSVFGIHSYSSWLVFIACVVMAGLRYCLEPTIDKSKFEMESNEDQSYQFPVDRDWNLDMESNVALSAEDPSYQSFPDENRSYQSNVALPDEDQSYQSLPDEDRSYQSNVALPDEDPSYQSLPDEDRSYQSNVALPDEDPSYQWELEFV